MVKVDGDSTGAEQALGRTDKGIGSLTAAATKGSVVFGAALAGGLALSAKAGMEFEKSMAQAYAIMDVTTAEMEVMEQAARDVATSTTFSASEAGDAYYFLASAGYSAGEAVKMLPGLADFAMAGQIDLATATDYLADSQAALGLKTGDAAEKMKQATRIADVFTEANIASNASVQDFAEALTNKAGASLRTVGKDIEEGTAVLAAYADQGVKGAEAGEKLYMITRDLQTAALNNADAFKQAGVAVYDSKGEMRNYADIISDLEQRLGPMSDAQKKAELAALGFTDRSTGALLSLLGTSEAIRGYEERLRSASGVTESVADKQLLNFSDQLAILRNKLSDVGISVYENLIQPLGGKAVAAISPLVTKLGEFVANIDKADPAVLAAIGGAILGALVPAFIAMGTAVWGAVAPLLPFVAAGALLAVAIGGIVDALGGVAAVKQMWTDFVAGVTGDYSKLSGSDASLATPLVKFGEKVREIKDVVMDFFTRLWENLQPLRDTFVESFGKMQDAFGPVMDRFKAIWADIGPLLTIVGGIIGAVLVQAIGQLVGIVNGVMNALMPLIQALQGLISIVVNVFKLIFGVVTGDGQMIKEAVAGIGQGIVDVFAGLWGAIVGFLTGFVDGVTQFFQGLFQTLVGGSIVPDMINAIVAWFAGLPGKVLAWVSQLVTQVVAAFVAWATNIGTKVAALITAVVTFFAGLPAKVLTWVANLAAGTQTKFGSWVASLLTTVAGFITKAVAFFAGLPGKAAGALSGLLGAIMAKFNAVSSSVSSWVSGLASSVLSWAGSIGRNIANGIKNGVSNTWSALVAKVKGLVNLLPAAVKKLLGISSPSKVFAGFGLNIGAGLVQGVEAMRKPVQRAADALAPSMNAVAPVGAMPGYAGAGGAVGARATYNFAGATFVLKVPDGKVSTFAKELSAVVAAGERKGRLGA
jgi:TP901 family phage tail tape measure protein